MNYFILQDTLIEIISVPTREVLITQKTNNRLPSPQAPAGEGATLLAATSGSQITNISQDI